MTNLDSILKSRDVTLPTKVHLVKAIFFPVVMYGYESWTIKKAGCQRTDASELWCWRTLESPLDCKIQPVHPKGDQSWMCSLEGLMLKLKCQYFGHLVWRTDSLEKTLMLGKIEGWRIRRWQIIDEMVGMCYQLKGHKIEQAPGVGDEQVSLACCSPWGHEESDKTEWLNWTELIQ